MTVLIFPTSRNVSIIPVALLPGVASRLAREDASSPGTHNKWATGENRAPQQKIHTGNAVEYARPTTWGPTTKSQSVFPNQQKTTTPKKLMIHTSSDDPHHLYSHCQEEALEISIVMSSNSGPNRRKIHKISANFYLANQRLQTLEPNFSNLKKRKLANFSCKVSAKVI